MKKATIIGFGQKKISIDGVEYTLQKIPFRSYLEIEDRCSNRSGVLMKANYLTELFKHCVVSPKVTLDNFDNNFGAASELAGEIESFLKSKAEQGADTEESEA
jgi:hypothetical protein